MNQSFVVELLPRGVYARSMAKISSAGDASERRPWTPFIFGTIEKNKASGGSWGWVWGLNGNTTHTILARFPAGIQVMLIVL